MVRLLSVATADRHCVITERPTEKILQESALLSEFRVDKDIPEYTQGAETM